MLTLNNLVKTTPKKIKRLGRGNASRGNYSGRGMKGQKARSGVGGLKQRGIKSWLMKLPKSRGFTSPNSPKENVSIVQLENNFTAGSQVTPFILKNKGLIDNYKVGVKIIGNGKLTKKLNVKIHAISANAKQAIIKAGGSIEIIPKKKIEKKSK
jgi:large subunit ribosomal protein L15